MLDRALDYLNAADAGSLPAAVQAEALRALERAERQAHRRPARVLAAFAGQAAYEDDGQGSARTWLRWQTRVTKGAAAVRSAGYAAAAHPVIGDALAAGTCRDRGPGSCAPGPTAFRWASRDDADEILAAAARSGVDLAGLGGLAQEMYDAPTATCWRPGWVR